MTEFRIAFITYEYPPDTGKGGIGTYTVQMTELLAAHHFDVHVFAGSHDRDGQFTINNVIVNLVMCSSLDDFKIKVVDRFSQIHLNKNFDCIESPEINANASFIKDKFPGLPLIVKIHAPNYLVESLKKAYVPFVSKARYTIGAFRRFKFDLGYWRSYDYKTDNDYQFTLQAQYITAPTLTMKNWIIKNWKCNPSSIHVVSNPVLLSDAFMTNVPSKNSNTILFYGRLNVLKGLVTITKAMKDILRNNKSWNWVVLGDDGAGPTVSKTMKEWMIETLPGVLDRVHFISGVRHEEIPQHLHDADIVVIPSLFESFSYVCTEAMMASKAIVGSAGTGISALIENGKSGYLADPEKPAEWKNRIEQLIAEPAMRKEIGKNAFQAIIDRSRLNTEIVGFYKSLKINRQTAL